MGCDNRRTECRCTDCRRGAVSIGTVAVAAVAAVVAVTAVLAITTAVAVTTVASPGSATMVDAAARPDSGRAAMIDHDF